jgi:iron complex transport system ATP-binding protein
VILEVASRAAESHSFFMRRTDVLAVEGVSVLRDDAVLLRAVDWTVRAGEHWVILGGNGSGKTSLLNVLTGYLTPTSGAVSLLGERFGESDWRKLRLRVGWVSSSVGQGIPEDEEAWETVASGPRGMVGLWAKIKPVERDEAIERLREIGCGGLVRRPWRVLSQGERQRVLIARALAAEPAVLFLDEPCAGLDPVARERFLHFLQTEAERKRGPALVLVTHHVEEVVPAFSHALLLREGTVVAAGERGTTLTTRNLQAAFGPGVGLVSRGGRYQLRIDREASR